METANKRLGRKFPHRMMELMNAFSAVTGGVGPR